MQNKTLLAATSREKLSVTLASLIIDGFKINYTCHHLKRSTVIIALNKTVMLQKSKLC